VNLKIKEVMFSPLFFLLVVLVAQSLVSKEADHMCVLVLEELDCLEKFEEVLENGLIPRLNIDHNLCA